MLKTDSTGPSIALVLGGHVNGYSIIKELYQHDIKNIALFDLGKSLARYSNKVMYRARIDKTSQCLLSEIRQLHKSYSYIVIYPTDDLQLENLFAIYDQIKDFCYVPFNPKNLMNCLDKAYQYKVCEGIAVPCPKAISIKKLIDLENIDQFIFPLVIKPATRKDLVLDVFRILYLETENDYLRQKKSLTAYIEQGFEFVVSEYIPGDDTNIYAYTCFRSQQGEILNSWTGKKLTQYPDNYGVFSSASNQAPEIIEQQGQALANALDAYGIIEPEFKYDFRDGKFKLTEINLRSMMWHRIGYASGVMLHKTQFNYATRQLTKKTLQNKAESIHFVLMLHEVPNLIARKGYWKYFKYNVFSGDRRVWAIFEWQDLKPFFYSLTLLSKMAVSACLRRFGRVK